MTSLANMLKGIGGEYELGRVLGSFGGLNYVFWPPIFQAWAQWNGQQWDPTAFCAAYGGGLALAAAGIGAMISLKDRGVASSRQVVAQPPLSDTGTEQK